MGLILGLDICDDYSQISSYDRIAGKAIPVNVSAEGSSERIPTVICKKKGENEWMIGQEAFRAALLASGTVVDRLVKLVVKGGTATLEGTKYRAEALLTEFIRKLVDAARRENGTDEVDSLVFTVHETGIRINDALIHAAENIGIDRENVHVYSHTECYTYYVLSQNADIWTNQVSLFDLREDGLFYYEMRAIRGRKPLLIEASREKLPDGFNIDILSSPGGEKMADTILSACAKRVMEGKIISSVILTGRGFTITDWAGEFLKRICVNRRRVFQASEIFAEGAAYAAFDLAEENSQYPYIIVCDGRIASTVTLEAICDGRNEKVLLAEVGTNWYEASSAATFILDDIHEIELTISPAFSNKNQTKTITLDELPARPNKATRIELVISFSSEKHMTVRIIDQGFGDIFPSSGKVIRQDFTI